MRLIKSASAAVLRKLASTAAGLGADLVPTAVRRYENIAELQAAAGLTSGQRVSIAGYYTTAVSMAPDGGGGEFVYRAGSTATHNGGTVFTATGMGAGRFLRIFPEGAVNVRWFGASPSLANNAAAIQAAIDTLLDVYIPAGTYTVTGIVNAYHFQRIHGDGYKSYLSFTSGGLVYDSTQSEVTQPYIWHFSLEDMRLSRAGTVGPALQFIGDGLASPNKGIARGSLKSVHITGSTGYGIDCSDYYIHDWHGIIVAGCATGVRFGQRGLIGTNVVRLHGGEIQGNGTGLEFESAKGIGLFGTSIEGNSVQAFAINNSATKTCNAIEFNNCWFEGNGGAAGDYDGTVGTADPNGPVSVSFNTCRFADAGKGKNHAVKLVKGQNIVFDNCFFNGYAISSVDHSPASGGAVTGETRRCYTDSGALITGESKFFRRVIDERRLKGSGAWDPPSVAAGLSATTTVAVAGAAVGDFVDVSSSVDLTGLELTASVSAADTVKVVLSNPTAVPVDLSNETVRVIVTPQNAYF